MRANRSGDMAHGVAAASRLAVFCGVTPGEERGLIPCRRPPKASGGSFGRSELLADRSRNRKSAGAGGRGAQGFLRCRLILPDETVEVVDQSGPHDVDVVERQVER